MRGKYSPTVTAAYMADQEWWHKYAGSDKGYDFVEYDPEGFDGYGYNRYQIDRAGNHEYDYIADDCYGENAAYNDASVEWGFDGVKPFERYAKEREADAVQKAIDMLVNHGYTVTKPGV